LLRTSAQKSLPTLSFNKFCKRSFATKVPTSVIADLRKQSGSPIKECKKALESTGGDLEAAWELLRKMGAATAKKKSGNATSHGLISISLKGNSGGIFQIASETDFVEGNPKFQDLTHHMASLAASTSSTGALNIGTFLDLTLPETNRSVADSVTDLVGSIRENLQITRAHQVRVEKGVVGGYLHNKIGENCGLRGSLVGLESDGDPAVVEKLAKDIAMHVVAHGPQPRFRSMEEVPESVLEKERDIIREQLSQDGKPPEVVEKIVNGRLKKFHQDFTLMNQDFCLADDSLSISNLIKNTEKEIGCSIKISQFVVYNLEDEIGEPVEEMAA